MDTIENEIYAKNDYFQNSSPVDKFSDCYCSLCKNKFIEGQFWIQCNVCCGWYHGTCMNLKESETNEIDEFHCKFCVVEFGPSKFKLITNNHRYDRTALNAENLPVQVGTSKFLDELQIRKFKKLKEVDILDGQDLSFDYLLKNGFKQPLLIKNPKGLKMKIPKPFSLDLLLNKLGDDFPVEVINVYKQETNEMRLIQLIEALNTKDNRKDIYNCISLELSKTNLSDQIDPPEIVSKLSWVDNCWPKDDEEIRPAVSKYCLLSMEKSYTDFHIDFSGTSVWYHILKGEKLFYFVPPTKKNLKAYENWINNNSQNEIFFPDTIESECFTYLLEQGNTMLIPTGWIHGVYTPKDSIVFGGNFLHSLNIDLQIKIFQLEEQMQTLEKFKFPHFKLTHWYAANFILKFLQNLIEKNFLKNNSFLNESTFLDLIKGFNSFVQFTENLKKEKHSNSIEQETQDYLPLIIERKSMKSIKKIQKYLKMVETNKNVDDNILNNYLYKEERSLSKTELCQKSVKLIHKQNRFDNFTISPLKRFKSELNKNYELEKKKNFKQIDSDSLKIQLNYNSKIKNLNHKRKASLEYKYSSNILNTTNDTKKSNDLPDDFKKILGIGTNELKFKIPKKKQESNASEWDF